jgi:hypothetical protein
MEKNTSRKNIVVAKRPSLSQVQPEIIKDSERKRKDFKIQEKKDPGYLLPTFNRTRLTPKTDEELDAMAHDLVLWAEQEDQVIFEEFVYISKTSNARLYEFAQRHKGLADAIVIAKQILCSRREKRALEGKYNPSIVMGLMGLYNPEYKAYRKELSQQQEQKQAQYTIIVDKVENSPLVPPKKDTHDREVV